MYIMNLNSSVLRAKEFMKYSNVYYITGTAYAGKSTMVRLLAEKYGGILCEENYHDRFFPEPDEKAFPCLNYTRKLEDWHDFIRRSPEEYEAWIDGVSKECEVLELKILEEENASLVAQKTKLEDPNYIETYARGEYMFSKDDEKVFYLPSASEETANTESPSAAPEGGSQ